MNVEEVSRNLQRIAAEIGRVLVGQEQTIEHVLVGLLSRGHILIEGVPGLGKTLLVRALSRTLGIGFRRIQFTPDLMPSDVTGSSVYSAKLSEFSFVRGPIFASLVLADEALVSAMQRSLAEVRVLDELLEYIALIVEKTRTHPAVVLGASPRASIGLLAIARARAVWEGRDFVIPDDVKSYARAVLRHRLLLQPDAELEGVTADTCVEAVLREVPVPKTSA